MERIDLGSVGEAINAPGYGVLFGAQESVPVPNSLGYAPYCLLTKLGSDPGLYLNYGDSRASSFAPFSASPSVAITASAGATDHTAVINDAVATMAAVGGGYVELLAGTFDAAGIRLAEGVYIVGQGMATIVRLRTGATTHLFAAEAGLSFDGGGVENMTLDGQGTTSYDAINFEAVDGVNGVGGYSGLQNFLCADLKITGFRTGIQGSGDRNQLSNGFDKLLRIRGCYVEFCVTGCWVKEHPIFEFGNHFWFCGTGIKGRLTDCPIIGQRFVWCDGGIEPTTGSGAALIHSCDFFKCVEGVKNLQNTSQVQGCHFTGAALAGDDGATASLTAIHVAGNQSQIQNNFILGAWDTAGIRLGAGDPSLLSIEGNYIEASAGPGILAGGGGSEFINGSINNNVIRAVGNLAIAFTDTYFRSSTLKGNRFLHASGNATAQVYLPYPEDSDLGGNTFKLTAGVVSYGLQCDGGPLRNIGFDSNSFVGTYVVGAISSTQPLTTLTISSDAIAIGSESCYLLAGQGGLADELATVNGGWSGRVVTFFPASDSVTITVKDGTGNLQTGGDRPLDNAKDCITLRHNGTDWSEVAFANNGA